MQEHRVTVDMHVSLGHILTLIGLLITVITWSSTVRAQVSMLDKRMIEVEVKLDKFTETYIATRVMDNKLDDLYRRVGSLERSSFASARNAHHVD